MISHQLNTAAVARLLRDPAGGVARDLYRRGVRVQGAARRLCPVDTGRLRASISVELRSGPVCRVGTSVDYALLVHDGHSIIRPKRGRYLVFQPRGGPVVFARQVRAVAGVPFLRDALPAARG